MKTTHKEESLVRITNDASDRNALKETLSLLIGPLNPSDHEQGQLLNIVTGQLAPPECNVDEAYDMVAKQMKEFRDKWPGGFYDKISKQPINIDHKRRHISVDNHKIISQDLIYARALGLLVRNRGGGPRVVVSTAAFHARVRGSVPGLGGLKETKLFLPHPRVKVSIVGSLRDREVACSASDRQGSNFESSVWRTVSSQSSHHPQEVLLAQFSLYVHKGGLKPDSFHLSGTEI